MRNLDRLYRHSLGLLTDLYQLTMAYGYWKSGLADREGVFHLFFRKNPFQGGFTVACGLEPVLEFLEDLRFEASDLEYLASLTGNDGAPLFEHAFLEALGDLRWTADVDAIPEGTVVFPQEPLIRIKGPLIQCQLVETPLLNMVNFQTLIATKAARVCLAAKGKPVVDFGLRRAQGVDGGLSASRAAWIGGVSATSNVLAGKLYGIPVKGTHAHSWVMTFDDEREAFETYAAAMPNNCVFLVDTYDTIQGVRNAVEVGKALRARGHEMVGVRLDSGDLAFLSAEARRILDEAGFPKAAVVASNDLDEHLIRSLEDQGARIDLWGVGTKMVTAYDQPALGGVYKLGAIRDPGGTWQHRIKLSEQAIKISTPGILQVRRFRVDGRLVADMIHDELTPAGTSRVVVDPLDPTRQKRIEAEAQGEDLLVPMFRAGERVYQPPPLAEVRARAAAGLESLHPGTRRFENPHTYPVGLEKGLHRFKTELVTQARGIDP